MSPDMLHCTGKTTQAYHTKGTMTHGALACTPGLFATYPSAVPERAGLAQRCALPWTVSSPAIGCVCAGASRRSLWHGLGRRVNTVTLPLLPGRSRAGASSASRTPQGPSGTRRLARSGGGAARSCGRAASLPYGGAMQGSLRARQVRRAHPAPPAHTDRHEGLPMARRPRARAISVQQAASRHASRQREACQRPPDGPQAPRAQATRGRGISGLACVYPRVLECTTGTRGQHIYAGVRWRVAPRRRVHDTTAGSRRIPSAQGTGLDPP